MAKQSGLHQIRGKVGEHSYYKQTGVSTGLIRSINQGLSSRVKTGAEYVNTRLNNAEFGQACTVAAALITYITPKYRPMILPFSQAKLAKSLLEVIKQSTGNWGQRTITDVDGSKIAPLLTALSKNNFDDYGIALAGGDDQLTIDSDSTQFSEKLASMGADGIFVRLAFCDTWIGKYSASVAKYVLTSPHANTYDREVVVAGESYVNAEYPAEPTFSELQSGSRMIVAVLMPYRTINTQKHIMQEYCAFKAFPEIALGD